MFTITTNSARDYNRFHIISSDKELLGRLTNIMQNKGYVSCWEKSGEMSFIIDGRKGAYVAAKQINEINKQMQSVNRGDNNSYQAAALYREIHRSLTANNLAFELKGTAYLADILFIMLQPGTMHGNLSKGVYQTVANKHSSDVRLIDRSIRYCKKKAGIDEPNSAFIQRLLLEIYNNCHQKFTNLTKPHGNRQISLDLDILAKDKERKPEDRRRKTKLIDEENLCLPTKTSGYRIYKENIINENIINPQVFIKDKSNYHNYHDEYRNDYFDVSESELQAVKVADNQKSKCLADISGGYESIPQS